MVGSYDDEGAGKATCARLKLLYALSSVVCKSVQTV